MPDKKYELTDETIELEGHILHRIRALKDFGNVKKGTLGGFIEKEDNLSHEEECWVYNDAVVYEGAKVYGSAKVYANARVYENAEVYGVAEVYGKANVYGKAEISKGKVSEGKLDGNKKKNKELD